MYEDEKDLWRRRQLDVVRWWKSWERKPCANIGAVSKSGQKPLWRSGQTCSELSRSCSIEFRYCVYDIIRQQTILNFDFGEHSSDQWSIMMVTISSTYLFDRTGKGYYSRAPKVTGKASSACTTYCEATRVREVGIAIHTCFRYNIGLLCRVSKQVVVYPLL